MLFHMRFVCARQAGSMPDRQQHGHAQVDKRKQHGCSTCIASTRNWTHGCKGLPWSRRRGRKGCPACAAWPCRLAAWTCARSRCGSRTGPPGSLRSAFAQPSAASEPAQHRLVAAGRASSTWTLGSAIMHAEGTQAYASEAVSPGKAGMVLLSPQALADLVTVWSRACMAASGVPYFYLR